MAEVVSYTISPMKDGRYRLSRTTGAGDVSTMFVLQRSELEDFFRESSEGTMVRIWTPVERYGTAEFSLLE